MRISLQDMLAKRVRFVQAKISGFRTARPAGAYHSWADRLEPLVLVLGR